LTVITGAHVKVVADDFQALDKVLPGLWLGLKHLVAVLLLAVSG
jgi:hypothetical protein